MEWGIVAVIAVAVIFGVNKLPDIARNFGRAQGEFKKGLKEGAVDDTAESTEPKSRVLVRPGIHLGLRSGSRRAQLTGDPPEDPVHVPS